MGGQKYFRTFPDHLTTYLIMHIFTSLKLGLVNIGEKPCFIVILKKKQVTKFAILCFKMNGNQLYVLDELLNHIMFKLIILRQIRANRNQNLIFEILLLRKVTFVPPFGALCSFLLFTSNLQN